MEECGLELDGPALAPVIMSALLELLLVSEDFFTRISEVKEIATLRCTVAARWGAAFMRSTKENLG